MFAPKENAKDDTEGEADTGENDEDGEAASSQPEAKFILRFPAFREEHALSFLKNPGYPAQPR